MSRVHRNEHSALASRLGRETGGEVLFDEASKGRYSTDASIYQITPIGVFVPRTSDDVAIAMSIARDEGVPILPRGAGTSQCGQTVGEALVIDTSKHLNQIVSLDAVNRRVRVQPGIVLDHLNAKIRSSGLFYPIDVSPANRATIGGMTGNNSCGSRSIRYGNMVHNVHSIRCLLADGTEAEFAHVPGNFEQLNAPQRYLDLVQEMRDLHARERDEIARRFPKLLRRVGGYNIDSIDPNGHNMAQLLVGSEGTLGLFTEIELNLSPLPRHKVLGVCHFPTFYAAMDATRHIVELEPSAVELVDRTLIDLARDIAMFRPTVERFVDGAPQALLLVEFAGDDASENQSRLEQLVALMGDLGYPNAVVRATDGGFQRQIWDVRKAGLNIMMSMKGDGKPISFVEDCAVSLDDLAQYTARLDEIFARHGTSGTWYAHASVGTLHVRPIINLKQPDGARQMRAIAEECFEMVREYKGSHSGEHGDGIVRSEFHTAMFGERIVRAFEEVKDRFDPSHLMNPGKIVHPHRMDDRELFRYKPGYSPIPIETALDWSEWGQFSDAVEMCNNNGTCRKSDPGVMCPSFRATHDEQHVTRGRANTLRLALTGQLGPNAFTSQAVRDAMDLCVGCKGCKRECPTGVDMARMKIEFQHHYRKHHGLKLRDRLVAWLPRYAPKIAGSAAALNWLGERPSASALRERFLGIHRQRSLPRWSPYPFRDNETPTSNATNAVVLFADTFNRWFEPENLRDATRVLTAAGYQIKVAQPPHGERPLCCGRTFLAAGCIEQARIEARRTVQALAPHARAGHPIIGLEPSCLLTLRDEWKVLCPDGDIDVIAKHSRMFEEFLIDELDNSRLQLTLGPIDSPRALLHGHCHQKAFDAMGAVQRTLRLIPKLEVHTVASSCCGMAGAFGYEAEHFGISMKMAELDLLPSIRSDAGHSLLVADGTSCRHQIKDGVSREALHVARVLARALDSATKH